MRLTDIMSNMDLDVYPTIGLVIFLIVFAAVVIRVLTTKKSHSSRMASMPLNEDVPARTEEPRHGA